MASGESPVMFQVEYSFAASRWTLPAGPYLELIVGLDGNELYTSGEGHIPIGADFLRPGIPSRQGPAGTRRRYGEKPFTCKAAQRSGLLYCSLHSLRLAVSSFCEVSSQSPHWLVKHKRQP
jgi:hypothetical protein